MCSIAGWYSSYALPAQVAEDLASALLYYGKSRGDQSAGVFVNDRVLKRAENPTALVALPEFSALFDGENRKALLHTRQPTSGGLGHAQAQPFRMDKTVSVHNGYYFDVKDLKQQHKIAKPSGVDSHLVTSFVHRYGPKKLPRFIRTTDGPSAIGLMQDEAMYLFRSGNPISYLTIRFEDNDSITVFASTREMVLNAIRYVYLLTNPVAMDLKEGFLFELTPTGVTQVTSEKASYQISYYTGVGSANYVHGSKEERSWERYMRKQKKESRMSLRDLKEMYPLNAEDINTLASEGMDAETIEDWLVRYGTLDYTPLTVEKEDDNADHNQ